MAGSPPTKSARAPGKERLTFEPSRHIATSNIAGFQHWDGATVSNLLKVGSVLQLVTEPDNPSKSEAVAIRWHGTKLGYVL